MNEKSLKNIMSISFPVFLIFFLMPLHSDSLWDKDFEGYLSKSFPYKAGESLLVVIDSEFQFSFNSSSKDNKLLNLEFKGGGYGDLFSFLPAVKSSGSGAFKTEDEISLSTQLTVQLVSIDSNDIAVIQGQRSVSVDGREESVSLNGSVSLKDVAKDRSVSIHRVINPRLSFSSLLLPSFETISDRDLEKIANEVLSSVSSEPGEGAGEPAATEEAGAAEEAGESGENENTTEGDRAVSEPGEGSTTTEDGSSLKDEYQLSETKKRELFLIYVNRLVDVLFSQASK